MQVASDAVIGGALSVAHASELQSSLLVAGAVTIRAAASLDGTLVVAGAVTLSNTLLVSSSVGISTVVDVFAASPSYSSSAVVIRTNTLQSSDFKFISALVGPFNRSVFSVDGIGNVVTDG